MRRAAGLVFSVLLFSVLTFSVTSCGTDNPTPPAAPTPSASLTPSVPVMPDAAKGTSRAAAKEFVRYYVAVQNAAAAGSGTAELRSLATDTCRVCSETADFIDSVYSHSGRISGDGWSVTQIRILGPGPQGLLAVEAEVEVAPQTVAENATASPSAFAGSPEQTKVFTLISRSGEWKLQDIRTRQQ